MLKGPWVAVSLRYGRTWLKTIRTTSAMTPAMMAAGSTCAVSVFLFGRNLYNAKIVTMNKQVMVLRMTVNLVAVRTNSNGGKTIMACNPVLIATNSNASAAQASVRVK